ncbi:MAG: hypothetical protein H7336_08075 [Bacteriovorax sp.]|nr:hypothetical protein [Bacteriovorax sp.]
MKTTSLILSILALAFTVSCADMSTKKMASKPKMKTLGPLDLNAKSAPINGYNYYALPSNAPVMEKQKTSKNTKTTTTPVKKSVIKK